MFSLIAAVSLRFVELQRSTTPPKSLPILDSPLVLPREGGGDPLDKARSGYEAQWWRPALNLDARLVAFRGQQLDTSMCRTSSTKNLQTRPSTWATSGEPGLINPSEHQHRTPTTPRIIYSALSPDSCIYSEQSSTNYNSINSNFRFFKIERSASATSIYSSREHGYADWRLFTSKRLRNKN